MSPATGRDDPPRQDLLREVEELRAENDRLRGLLGLDERPDDGHVQAWTPTLLAESIERPAVEFSSTSADKLALFWSPFGTRAGGHWIAGERMRDGSADALEALSRGSVVDEARGAIDRIVRRQG